MADDLATIEAGHLPGLLDRSRQYKKHTYGTGHGRDRRPVYVRVGAIAVAAGIVVALMFLPSGAQAVSRALRNRKRRLLGDGQDHQHTGRHRLPVHVISVGFVSSQGTVARAVLGPQRMQKTSSGGHSTPWGVHPFSPPAEGSQGADQHWFTVNCDRRAAQPEIEGVCLPDAPGWRPNSGRRLVVSWLHATLPAGLGGAAYRSFRGSVRSSLLTGRRGRSAQRPNSGRPGADLVLGRSFAHPGRKVSICSRMETARRR
jgi:hypothetical protein